MDQRAGNAIGYEHIEVGAAAGIATITMNRPERRNALSEAHMRELIAALRPAVTSRGVPSCCGELQLSVTSDRPPTSMSR